MRTRTRRLAMVVAGAVVLYAVLSAALFTVMSQPPEVIGSVFKRTPWP